MELLEPENRVFEPCILIQPEQLFDLRTYVDLTDPFIESGHESNGRDFLDQRAIAGFQAGPLTDVANGADDHQTCRRLQRIEADLDGKLFTVFPQPEQLDTRPHGPRSRGLEKLVPVADVLRPEPLRHEEFDRNPAQLLRLVAEHIRGLGIGQDDRAFLVDHNEGIGQSLWQTAEQGFDDLEARYIAADRAAAGRDRSH